MEQLVDQLENPDVKGYAWDDTGNANNNYGVDFNSINADVNALILQKIYCTETWVYAAVNAIADTISGLPLKVQKRKIVKKQVTNEATGEVETVEQESWVDASGEPLQKIFESPNPALTESEFLKFIVIDLMTTGEYFIYLDSDKDLATLDEGRETLPQNHPLTRLRNAIGGETPVEEMYRLSPPMMELEYDEEKGKLLGYTVGSEGGAYKFDPAEIIHIKFPNPLNPRRGLSPLIPAFREILKQRLADEGAIRFYKSGARLGGVIESEKDLTKEQITRVQRTFDNNYTGTQNQHKTLILPNQMKYKTIQVNPVESSLIEASKSNREGILSALKVPPIKVGIMDHANYANANAQLKLFFDQTIKPLLTYIEDGFNRKESLMPDGNGYRVKFDLTDVEVLRENFLEKAQAGKEMLNAGLSPNEVRKRVWQLGPVTGGDKVKAVEDMKRDANPFPLFGSRSAVDGEIKADEQSEDPMQGFLAGLSGPQVTSVMNILGRVSRGKLAKDAAAEMLISMFGFTRELANKILGIEAAPVVNKDTPQADIVMTSPIVPTDVTFQARVAELTQQFMSEGLTLTDAIAKAVAQAITEGFNPEDDPTKPSGTAPNKPGADLANSETGKEAQPENVADQSAIQNQAQVYSFGMSKDEVVNNWKAFIDKSEVLINKRLPAVQRFFNDYKSIVMNRLGANIKAYGSFKSRDSEDADEILDEKAFEELLKKYAKDVDQALMEAYASGFTDTLVNFEFGEPNEAAKKFLQKYAADRVVGISDTTRAQLKTVLVDAFEAGVSVQEVSSRIQEKFAEINAGRAMTIARTETLSAVSAGQQEKREEVKKQFPDKKLKKAWVSAQDEKVRDSHQELDGNVVDVDDEFKANLKYPRDPAGAPEEVINCRCTTITFFEEDEAQVQDSLGDGE